MTDFKNLKVIKNEYAQDLLPHSVSQTQTKVLHNNQQK